MNTIFSFKVSTKEGTKNLWLEFPNGMINLSVLADRNPRIIGKQLRQAIEDYFYQNKEVNQ